MKTFKHLSVGLLLITNLSAFLYADTRKKPCRPTLADTAPCTVCSFDQWAEKVFTLKERPVQFSSLPNKKEYQKNILTVKHFVEALQQAASAIASDTKDNEIWLSKKSIYSELPNLYTLKRAFWSPAKDVRNYPFRPSAQRLWLTPGSTAILFGDLHGSIHSFIRDLKKLRSLGYLGNNFKIIKKDTYLVFLGDYIDRGIYGTEVMYTLARLKSANPHHAVIVRGNHEDFLLVKAFQISHTKHEEKDSAPNLIEELQKKFDLDDEDIISIFRFYETLPVVLYLGSGTQTHHDYMQCCHGGIEIGYDPQPLLHAEDNIRFEQINKLWRRKYFAHKLSKQSQNDIKLAFDLDTLCVGIQDITPTSPVWKDPVSKRKSYLGFLWNDFFVDPTKTVTLRGKKGTGWVCGKGLTENVLSWGNSNKVTLQGLFRAHQHNNETGGPMLNLLCCGQGVARIWNKNIYTFVSSPDSKLEDTGDHCFTYDSFVILKTAPAFKDWKMDHYIQDGALEKKQWKVVPVKPVTA